MRRNIVSDTSCLILFQKIERLDLLYKVFGRLMITPEVALEFSGSLPDWIEIHPTNFQSKSALLSMLDNGEASAISLAIECKDSLLIIDEIRGRRVAQKLGLAITGVLGVLILCKKKGYIKSLKDVLYEISSTNFRISSTLIDSALKSVGES